MKLFGKDTVKTVCDTPCRAAQIRAEALFKAAQQGPRI